MKTQKKNLFGSIFAGVSIGVIVALLSHQILAIFLVSAPYSDFLLFPRGLFSSVLLKTLGYAIAPGILIGYIGGLFSSIDLPPGNFSKFIAVFVSLVCIMLTWFGYWDFVLISSPGKIGSSIFITVLSFYGIFPLSKKVLVHLEKFRYK